MWTSVPQMVVVVTRSSASSGPTSGIGFSSSTIRPGSTKTAARIILAIVPILSCRPATPPADAALVEPARAPGIEVDQGAASARVVACVRRSFLTEVPVRAMLLDAPGRPLRPAELP